MDEKGQVLFDNLAWFVKKLCSVMTSDSACEHMWNIEGWIHNKRRNRLAQPNVERTVSVQSSRRLCSYPNSRKSHGTHRPPVVYGRYTVSGSLVLNLDQE
jgi:hypothetical protein